MGESTAITTDEGLRHLLQTDVLAVAETVTGKSYKEDEATQSLERYCGFRLMVDMVQKLQMETLNAKPYHIQHSVESLSANYFQLRVLHTFFIYWHDDGLLLKFDTFGWNQDEGEPNVNGGKVHYCWRPNEDVNRWDLTSSGQMTDSGVWAGNHDCREALIFNLEQLRANGEFVKPWVGRHFLWLLHYMDTKDEDYDYKAITIERAAMLPADVREVIGNV
jgi:hypothetical protein